MKKKTLATLVADTYNRPLGLPNVQVANCTFENDMKILTINPEASAKFENEPQKIGEILDEYLCSNEPLAISYREWLQQENVEHLNFNVDGKK